MLYAKPLSVGLLLGGLMVVGCSKPAETTGGNVTKSEKSLVLKDKKDDHDDHDHGEGPHGGTVLEFGKYHGEFVVDHDKKQATVYILDGKVKNAVPIPVEKLTLSIKDPPFQTDLLASPQEGDPKGKCSRFVATHEHFGKVQEFEGTVSGEIDSKPYHGDFKEKSHDHAKK